MCVAMSGTRTTGRLLGKGWRIRTGYRADHTSEVRGNAMTRGIRWTVAGIAVAAVATGCSSSADPSANVAAACTAFQDSGDQYVDTIGPYLDDLVQQAQQAATADATYEDFADAAVVLRDSLMDVGEGSEDDVVARQDAMLVAVDVIEGYCQPS